MPRDNFVFRKNNQLGKADKSIRQEWDERIAGLCELINCFDNYYTTSSCSGRVLLLFDSREKRDDLFLKVWHDEIDFEDLKKVLGGIDSLQMIYFKQEPCILHVACRSLEDAQKMHDLGKAAGWKRCGIIASDKRYVVELNASEKLEFPVFADFKVLVSDEFLKVVVSEANKKLERSWERISKLKELIQPLKGLS